MKKFCLFFILWFLISHSALSQWTNWQNANLNACVPIAIKYKKAASNFGSGSYEIKVTGSPNNTCVLKIRSYFINTYGKVESDDESLSKDIGWYSKFGNPFNGIRSFMRAEVISAKGCTCVSNTGNSEASSGYYSQPIDPGPIDGRTGQPRSTNSVVEPSYRAPALSTPALNTRASSTAATTQDSEESATLPSQQHEDELRQELNNIESEAQARSVQSAELSQSVADAAVKVIDILTDKSFENEMEALSKEYDKDEITSREISEARARSEEIVRRTKVENIETANYTDVIRFVNGLPYYNKTDIQKVEMKKIYGVRGGIKKWGNITHVTFNQPTDREIFLNIYILSEDGRCVRKYNYDDERTLYFNGSHNVIGQIQSFGQLHVETGDNNVGHLLRSDFTYPSDIMDGRYTILLYEKGEIVYKNDVLYTNAVFEEIPEMK